MVGNKHRPGVDAGPRLNAGVRGVLKEINAWALFQEIWYVDVYWQLDSNIL